MERILSIIVAVMSPAIRLGRWFGVPVGLHYSWFVIAWLMTLSLVTEFARNPGWGLVTVWSLAIMTAVLFFACIVLHELAHAVVGRRNDVPVRGITLFALGGIAQIERDASTPAKEFWMAIAGPGASFFIGFGCRVLSSAIRWVSPTATSSALSAILGWLAYINVTLALFNLIPAFPLDGGSEAGSSRGSVRNQPQRSKPWPRRGRPLPTTIDI